MVALVLNLLIANSENLLSLDTDLKYWVLRNTDLLMYRVYLEVCSKNFLINYLFLEGGCIRKGKQVDKTYIYDFKKILTTRVTIFSTS